MLRSIYIVILVPCTACYFQTKFTPDFVNKIFSVIENSNKQQIRHKQTRVNEVNEIYLPNAQKNAGNAALNLTMLKK